MALTEERLTALANILNGLDWEDFRWLWGEIPEFEEKVSQFWADEAEAHAERLAEDGNPYYQFGSRVY